MMPFLKKLTLISVLVFSILKVNAQCGTPISTYPYVEDFETSAAWTSGGAACTPLGLVINDWAWCHPQKNVINTAGSGQRCWMVGDSVGWLYAYGERSWVQSPCFDMTSLQHPFIQLKIFWESENKYDGALLQYSLDAGNTWSNVGAYGDPTDCMDTNWYNYNSITNVGSYSHSLPGYGNTSQTYPALTNTKNGWCGNIQAANYTDTTGVSGSTCQAGRGLGHWVTAKHCMPYLTGQPQVIFRMAFGAGTSCNNFNGFAFDSVAIGEGAPNTADFTHTCINTNTIQFNGIATLCPDTFQWNFGDPASGASNTILGAGNLTPTHTFSGPGTYNVTFTVKGGPCNGQGVVTKAVQVISATTNATPAGCSGATGSAIAVVLGGAQPYNYSWSSTPAQHTDTATNLAAGTYTVTITTANACSATASAVITQASALAHTTSVTNASCGASNGSATVTETGGTNTYTYHWSNGGTTATISGVAAGTYTVTVTDANGCTDLATVTIGAGSSLAATITNTTNISCHGQTNGSITVNVTGGTSPYEYHWSATDSTTTGTHNNLAAGNYTITVTDAHGCQSILIDSITQPTAITDVITTVPSNCGQSNGSATVTVSGGSPGYTYLWSGGLGTTNTINNIGAGSYTLTVTDSKSCKDTIPVNVNNTGGVTANLSATTNVTCPGGTNGSITINATGGTMPYTYHWGIATTAVNTQTGFAAGNYTITVTDAAGCIANVTATITEPAAFAHTFTTNSTTCGNNNGVAKIIETGGTPNYTYAWSGNSSTVDSIINAAPGIYTVTITDANSCTDVATITIGAIPPVTAALGTVINDSCFGYNDGSITVNATSGTSPYTYHWGGGNITNLSTQGGFAAGTYIVTVTDANNCSATVSATINQPSQISVTPTPVNVICPGGNTGAVSLAVAGGNGGFTYSWSNTAQTTANITNLTTGTYNVTVKDIFGCSATATATLTSPPPFAISFPTVINDSCAYGADGSATVLASGASPGYTYLWSNGATTTTITGLAPGVYKVTITDASLCTTIDSVTIAPGPAINIQPSTTPIACFNDSNGAATVTVSGGTPGYTYVWNNGGTTSAISNLKAGNYIVTVTDNWGCTAVNNSINLINPAVLGLSISSQPQSCATFIDGSVTVVATGGTPNYTYQWAPVSGAGSTLSGLAAGTYYCTVSDSHGCTATDSSTVLLAPSITIQPLVIQPLCPPLNDGSISITATGGTPGYTYSWSNNSNGNAVDANLGAGAYSVTVTDSKGCALTDSFSLSYQYTLKVNAGITDTINLGDQVTLTALANPAINEVSYVWSPDYQLTCTNCQSTMASPLQTLVYTVDATDTNGCKATDSVMVVVNVIHNLYIPNAFTPNGNGVNDYFAVFGNKEAWKYLRIDIFDRWGEKVFESTDLDFKWDGRYRGVLQEPNVFVYVFNLTYIDGYNTGVLKGSITLIR